MVTFNENSVERYGEGSVEQEPTIDSKVILEFFRHGKKEADPEKANKDLLLTSDGSEQAIQKGKKAESQADVAVAWGGPKVRSRQSAILALLANESIDSSMSMDEIEDAVDKEINKNGTNMRKVIEDERLDFNFNGPGIGEWTSKLYKGEEPFLKTYLQESDQRALEAGDKENDTYTRKAGAIAEIVLRYLKVANTFNRIIAKTDKYEENGNQLERYLGTHGSVLEPLVAKILEKMNGVEARDEFAEAIGNDFPEAKGIRIEIVNHGEEQEITLSYEAGEKTEEIQISMDLLEEIIQDRDKFEERFK